MNRRYLEWLCNRVGLDMTVYGRLASCLYSMPFEWPGRIPLDANRSSDGVMLRYYYKEDTGMVAPNSDADCSVLEMLVALCERIDDIMGEPGEIHYDFWFRVMMQNLHLCNQNNDDFDRNKVVNTMKNWMTRNIDLNGEGGAFPLKYPMEDQRDVSIWDQMSCYMNENY